MTPVVFRRVQRGLGISDKMDTLRIPPEGIPVNEGVSESPFKRETKMIVPEPVRSDRCSIRGDHMKPTAILLDEIIMDENPI